MGASASPAGLFLYAYSPEAPAEKIECFEFEKLENDYSGTRLFLANGRSVLVTNYRNRGTIPYVIGLTPSHPDFEKYLKLYEEKATAIPSTRRFLNPRIQTMRNHVASAAKQNEAIAKLLTITLADGKLLRGCVMTKIDNGSVTIRHQDGVKMVSFVDLDDAEKAALNATSENWSLEDPSITYRDSSGTYAKIVLKNGAVLKNVKFKGLSEKKLLFTQGNKIIPVAVDQLPNDRSALGAEVINLFAPKIEPVDPTRPKTSSNDNKHLAETRDVTKPYEPVNAVDQLNLGFAYAEGKGVPKDEVESVKWYRKAANQRLPLAQRVLGTSYAEGKGIPKDEQKAVYWYKKAADQGEAEAQCFLAISYEKGTGVPKDDEKAIKWYNKAADQGVAVAKANLSAIHAKQKMGPEDQVESDQSHKKTADQDNLEAPADAVPSSEEDLLMDEEEPDNWYGNITYLAVAVSLAVLIGLHFTIKRRKKTAEDSGRDQSAYDKSQYEQPKYDQSLSASPEQD